MTLFTINELPTHRMLIVGDFNLGQMLPEHVAKVNPLIQILTCLSVHNIHRHGGILDLVFDTSNSNAISFLPSPFSGHFVLFFSPNLMHSFIQNLAVNNLAFNPHYITHKYLC